MNQKEKHNLKTLRKFNTYCYGQYYNIKKLFTEAQKQNKSNKELYDDIKTSINISLSFGQCPYQLLTEVHPSKNKTLNKGDNCSVMSTPTPLSENNNLGDYNINNRYNSVMSNKSNKGNSNNNMIIVKKKKILKKYIK